MNIELTDRDQACIAFMIDQTARQIPFLKQSANESSCEALDALLIDINNLLAKLVIFEYQQTTPTKSCPMLTQISTYSEKIQ